MYTIVTVDACVFRLDLRVESTSLYERFGSYTSDDQSKGRYPVKETY